MKKENQTVCDVAPHACGSPGSRVAPTVEISIETPPKNDGALTNESMYGGQPGSHETVRVRVPVEARSPPA
jgi:hypothetical protein